MTGAPEGVELRSRFQPTSVDHTDAPMLPLSSDVRYSIRLMVVL